MDRVALRRAYRTRRVRVAELSSSVPDQRLQTPRTGTTKRSNYSNPELDKLIEEQQKTPDFKKRTAILQQAGKIIMDEAPFVPLYNLADIYGVTKNVSWKVRPDEKVLAWDMKIT